MADVRPIRPLPDLLDRGVYQIPWLGRAGELLLIAVTADHKFSAYASVPHGTSLQAATERLQADLDRDDPVPRLKVI